jgi:hypothetical protein
VTEQEWLESGDPVAMLTHLGGQRRPSRTKAGKRRLRLFACACLRRQWDLIGRPQVRDGVVVCERYADGLVTSEELWAAVQFTSDLDYSQAPEDMGLILALLYAAQASVTEATLRRLVVDAATAYCQSITFEENIPFDSPEWLAETRAQADLLREVFGNPFRPPARRTLSPDLRSLAQVCYDGDAAAFPLLADALDDLGEAGAAAHCRRAGHVKGCHVVDWALGKL